MLRLCHTKYEKYIMVKGKTGGYHFGFNKNSDVLLSGKYFLFLGVIELNIIV